MSKIPNNSYFVPRELEQGEYFKKAQPLWKLVMYWLLSHSVYKDELPYDLHGSIVILKKGQVAFSLRQIAEDLHIDKNDVDGAVLHFSGYTTKRKESGLLTAGHRPVLVRQESGQGSRQEKSVYNIMWIGYYESGQTEMQTEMQMGGQTRSRQEADTNKKDKKEEKDERSGSLTKVNSPPPPNLLKEERSRGGRKEAYKSKGPISEQAKLWHEITKAKNREIKADLLQGWIDVHTEDRVREALRTMDAEIEKGTKVKLPNLYVGGILRKMYAEAI